MTGAARVPGVVVVTLSPDELHALVRAAVREALAEQSPAAPAAPLVGRHELARLLGVSAATVTRMTGDGMPHVFAGASPRYAPDDVRAWLAERGRKATKAAPARSGVPIPGVRLLSRSER